MILILKSDVKPQQRDAILELLHGKNLKTHLSEGENTTIVGLVGDTTVLDIDNISAIPGVLAVRRIQEPFKRANRKFSEDDTVVNVAGRRIGGGYFAVIAGPCSVESAQQVQEVAKEVKSAGANFLRGGAYKPRTSPYAFQGLEGLGLEMLSGAGKLADMPIVSEIMDISDIDNFLDVDIIQVGARNMQNFRLLKKLGQQKKPILLKRGLSSTIEELLMSAEYIMSEGNEQVILCERGIRTFEPSTRNTLDISAVPVLKRLTHLPVIVDPSHAGGHSYLVPALSKAAVASGADGVMIEVHNNPAGALSDGAQSLNPKQFAELMDTLKQYVKIDGKVID